MLLLLAAAMMTFAKTTTLWSGSFTANNWNNWQDVTVSGANAGDKLVFRCSTSSGAQIQVNNSSWKPIGSDYNNISGDFTLAVTSTNKSDVNGTLHVKGQNFTLTRVELVSSDDSGSGSGSGGGSGSGSGSGGDNPSTGGFYVSGTQLLDAKGNAFVMRGVNYSWCWQDRNGDGNTADNVIPAAHRIGANCIRIQLSDGHHGGWTCPSDDQLRTLIDLCEQNKLIAIFNTHDETGSDNVDDLMNAVNFWIGKKDILNAHKSTVIVNISNEWCGSWDSNTWATGYKKAIPALRDAGIENTLMVDCAGWGQYPQSIFDRGAEVAATDKAKNTVFSIHMYEYAGKAGSVQPNIDQALNTGYPVVIGEFGYSRGSGKDVDWQTILNYCQQKQVGYIGWSWTGNGGSDSVLDMFSDYDGYNMLTNGNYIIKGTNGIAQTSKTCTVYTDTPTDVNSQRAMGEPIAIVYYTLSGQRIEQPRSGIFIKLTRYADNSITTTKVRR